MPIQAAGRSRTRTGDFNTVVPVRGIPERIRISGTIDPRVPNAPQTAFDAYVGGGLNTSNVAQSLINALNFPTDTTSASTATLSSARGHSGPGNTANTTKVFFTGGQGSGAVDVVAKATSTRTSPSSAQSPVGIHRAASAGRADASALYGIQGNTGAIGRGWNMVTDTHMTLSTMPGNTIRTWSFCNQNPAFSICFFPGGSTNDSNTGTQSNGLRYVVATNTWTSVVGYLSVNRWLGSSMSLNTSGMNACGRNSNPEVVTTDRFTYATETRSNGQNAPVATLQAAGCGNLNQGYMCGGGGGGSAQTAVRKFVHASDAWSSPTNLTVGLYAPGAG